MNIQTKAKIKEHLQNVMIKIIKRRVEDDPFDAKQIRESNPFGYCLVPEAVWKGSKFERSFVTTLGQGVFEQIARLIAEDTGATAINQYSKIINVNSFQAQTIEQLLEDQRSKRRQKGSANELLSIDDELLTLRNLSTRSIEERAVLFDLYVKRQDGNEEYYSLKTVKPNLDQTEKAKKDMLLLMTAQPRAKAYFALPYNPAGEGNTYSGAFTIPYKLFNMDREQYVLIGSEFWNKLGQNANVYGELMTIFEEVGKEFSIEEIDRRYFSS